MKANVIDSCERCLRAQTFVEHMVASLLKNLPIPYHTERSVAKQASTLRMAFDSDDGHDPAVPGPSVSAPKLFWYAAAKGNVRPRDLVHVGTALRPKSASRRLIRPADRNEL